MNGTGNSAVSDLPELDPEEEARCNDLMAELTDPAVRCAADWGSDARYSLRLGLTQHCFGVFALPAEFGAVLIDGDYTVAVRLGFAGFAGAPCAVAIHGRRDHSDRLLSDGGRVEYIIKILGLQRCADTVVGNQMVWQILDCLRMCCFRSVKRRHFGSDLHAHLLLGYRQ